MNDDSKTETRIWCNPCGMNVLGVWDNGHFECERCEELLPIPCDHLRKLIADGAPEARVMDWVWKNGRSA